MAENNVAINKRNILTVLWEKASLSPTDILLGCIINILSISICGKKAGSDSLEDIERQRQAGKTGAENGRK